MTQYEGRPVELADDVGHRESLARTGHAQQRIVLRAVPDRGQ